MGRGFKLSQLKIDRLRTIGIYGDGAGLSMKVTKGGSKSWIYRYMLGIL